MRLRSLDAEHKERTLDTLLEFTNWSDLRLDSTRYSVPRPNPALLAPIPYLIMRRLT
jgi:hypothetical protein